MAARSFRLLGIGRVLAGAAAAASFSASFSASCDAAPPKPKVFNTAVCTLTPYPPTSAGGGGVRGTVRITQARRTGRGNRRPVKVRVQVSGLAPNSTHGLHVHTLGDLTQGCASAGGHFNPMGSPHGGPTDPSALRHFGDLGNVVASDAGEVDVELEDVLISLTGHTHSILGRSMVLHADADDLGRGDFPDSKTTGHSGARIACGVIGIGEDLVVVSPPEGGDDEGTP